MKYMISLNRNWHARRDFFYTPGIYRVPEDMDEAHALIAIADSVGEKISAKAAAPENKARAASPEKKVGGPTGGAKPSSLPQAGRAKTAPTSKKPKASAGS